MSGSVHVWGFYAEDGNPKKPDSAAPSDLGVYEHFCQVRSNVTHHGGDIVDLRTTRTLDGWLVGAEFDVPAHNEARRIWHVICKPAQEWPRMPRPAIGSDAHPSASEAPQSAQDAAEAPESHHDRDEGWEAEK